MIHKYIVFIVIRMLSQKTRYALHALFVLTKHKGPDPLMIAQIADQASVPKKFLEQILLELKRRGIVYSVRGKHGGYTLGRKPEQIAFAEIIRAIDGPLALAPCVSVTAYRRCDDCEDEKTCAIRKVLFQVRNSTAKILENYTLADALSLKPEKTKRS